MLTKQNDGAENGGKRRTGDTADLIDGAGAVRLQAHADSKTDTSAGRLLRPSGWGGTAGGVPQQVGAADRQGRRVLPQNHADGVGCVK